MKRNEIMYLDLETDGYGTLNPPKQKIVQMGYIIGDTEKSMINKEIKEVNEKVVPYRLDKDFKESIPYTFEEMMMIFYNDLKRCKALCIHNSAFDVGVILNELSQRQILPNIKKEMCNKLLLDTMLLTTNLCKLPSKWRGYKWPKLEELYMYCFNEKPKEKLHNALNDCKVMKRSFEYLIDTNLIKTSQLFYSSRSSNHNPTYNHHHHHHLALSHHNHYHNNHHIITFFIIILYIINLLILSSSSHLLP